VGFAAASGRYAAFLDYDDTVYPEAYTLLVARLRESGARIAFGGIVVKRVLTEGQALYSFCQERPFVGKSIVDLFRSNFCQSTAL